MTLVLRAPGDEIPPGLTPQTDHRGIAIHWQAPPPIPHAPPKRRRRSPPLWNVQRIGFHALSSDGSNTPPSSAEEERRYALAAYVIAACHHPIPSETPIVYEVRR